MGTDPTLAMRTRREPDFIRYRPCVVCGIAMRLVIWGRLKPLKNGFDSGLRLKPDYVPPGFHLAPGPIKGHEFGLKLSAKDKGALIAFLKSL